MNPVLEPYVLTDRLADSLVSASGANLLKNIPVQGACHVLIEVTEGQIIINDIFITKSLTDSSGNIFPGVRVFNLNYPYLFTGNLAIKKAPGYTGIVKMCYEVTNVIT